MTRTHRLRRLLERSEPLVAPFVYDALQARLAQAAGLEAVYMTGFGTAAARGYPDLGLLTMSEMVENARRIARSVEVPVICDADTGYGNPLNVQRTVREYEDAGAAALHLEDQVFPKRCGFLDGKQVIPLDEMVPKVKAACEARTDPDFVIIARTDALAPLGWDEVERRARAYRAAGADLLFVDGIRTLPELEAYSERLGDLPLLYNGQLLPVAELAKRRFRLILHTGTLGAVYAAIRDAMVELKRDGEIGASRDPGLFGELVRVMGVPETLEQARRYER
jgi:2-methylisocitrate lyase-like PEP mutase family enzyme